MYYKSMEFWEPTGKGKLKKILRSRRSRLRAQRRKVPKEASTLREWGKFMCFA